mmetsp:Transcript_15897/g.24500  ORF Transcript_15897/g.24500 Transcript_15897/m.24500 type:complete len:95 (+) Transcript_15897:512-796(+)
MNNEKEEFSNLLSQLEDDEGALRATEDFEVFESEDNTAQPINTKFGSKSVFVESVTLEQIHSDFPGIVVKDNFFEEEEQKQEEEEPERQEKPLA